MNDSWVNNRRRRDRARAEVFAEWGTVCHLCGGEGADTVDHVVPRSVARRLGLEVGVFDVENLRPAHRRCNSGRGVGVVRKRPAISERAAGW